MTTPSGTVRQLIREHHAQLTQSERKFAQALLDDYPGAGLSSITQAAANAGVSTPTVARMVQKLGFKGYPAFHAALLGELQAKVSGPEARRAVWAAEAPDSHLLNRFAEAVTQNLRQTFAHVDTAQFDAAAARLASPEGRLYVVGGRITRSLAEYAFTHFQAIRARVTHLTSSSATWPHYVLDMTEGDTLLIFDIRRYEENLLRLAEIAQARGMQVILITDQWSSPIASVAAHTFNCWVEIPSAWDSNIATLSLVEALVAAAQEHRWPEARDRFERLDALFELTRLFRKP
ncbi:MurR/RpiR family transcriptional regulator [Salipiger marinus]|jgi:DNA-binding MurR/RpiR family transcriptional regulator|uniref:MurR/RpiR family transcriptional regulator n=1 Tax=Salipiger marinus TaxID=555512 RepID=UPI000E9BDF20|nr:MurR/RpiR family transcriptional regulator [Salipiger manganoxidans]MCD1619584.1 MurR/RpiR family transcriptional regulator [Salipiger manganoxidans]MEB3419452.1 MurR/RpiR family transcriptional regulator [Salipiger manganoxidans]HBM59216.1 RpiR family transcriptional regulator [Citreicella sp.]HBS98369.1 RpiR family transcriptional regulator [Citreicella sp.]